MWRFSMTVRYCLDRGLGLRVVALVLAGVVLVACSAGDDDVVSVQQEDGSEIVVDWSQGREYEQQVEEIKLVNTVMVKHFGEKVLPRLDGGPWDLQLYLNRAGRPYSSYRGDDAYYFRVSYDFSEIEANQETQEKALAVLEELGLTPNGELPTTYDADRRDPLYVAGGHDDHGRLFLIEQRHPDAEIKAIFWTRHSDHQSMQDAQEANWDD